MFRLFDPYAMAMCFLVGGVGFGITYYINTAVNEWGAEEIAYPLMAMVRDRPLETDRFFRRRHTASSAG